MLPILIIGLVVILLAEWTLWRLFRQRIAGLLFPRDVDTSSMRFFSLVRLRLCAIIHGLFLALVLFLSFLFLW